MRMLEKVEVTASFEEGGKKVKKTVGVINVEQFENVGEAEQHLGSELCLEMVNVQWKTRKMNQLRQQATGQPSSKALQGEAIARIFQSPELQKKMAEVQGDPTKIAALVQQVTDTIKAEKKAQFAASAGALPAAGGTGGAVTTTAAGGDDEDDDEEDDGQPVAASTAGASGQG